ncbi:MAG: nickel-type superoxide dismutase maturation protease [Actinomycetes bacterium]
MAVSGPSMLPALSPGDWLLVRWGARVRPGDVVVLRRPDRADLLVVKRAVRRLDRGWWVAGDNPGASDDSRTFGVVPVDQVLGRVLCRYWPLRRRNGHR